MINSATYFPGYQRSAAEICSTSVESLPTVTISEYYTENRIEKLSFLDYAANHWGQYAAQAGYSEGFAYVAF